MLARILLSLFVIGLFAATPMIETVEAKPSQSVSKKSVKYGKTKTRKKSKYVRTSSKKRKAGSKTRYKSTAYRGKKSARYKKKKTKQKASYAALGIRNMRHAKDTRKGRMSTRADRRWKTAKDWGRRASYKYAPGTVVVSNYTRKLYYVVRPGKVITYPIATPKANEIWSGRTRVTDKKVNPDWYPTEDMREKNPDLPEKVTGGSRYNPLGARALYLGKSLYRIHGTNSPNSIGRAASAGCYRMHNKHIRSLYRRIKVGTPVVVTNKSRL